MQVKDTGLTTNFIHDLKKLTIKPFLNVSSPKKYFIIRITPAAYRTHRIIHRNTQNEYIIPFISVKVRYRRLGKTRFPCGLLWLLPLFEKWSSIRIFIAFLCEQDPSNSTSGSSGCCGR